MDTKEDELLIVNIQTILSLTLIGTTIIGLLIVQNRRLKLNDQIPFWNDQEVATVAIIIRFVILLIAATTIYVCFKILDVEEKKHADTRRIESVKKEIFAAGLVTLAALLILIAVIESGEDSLIDFPGVSF